MSGSSKFARGVGRGRMLPQAPPPMMGRQMIPLKRAGAPGKSKVGEIALKGDRGLGMKSAMNGVAREGGNSQEENFQLVSCKERGTVPLLGMAVRIAPPIFELLKRAEELGEPCSMMFSTNKSEHILRIGDEEIPFSSAPEPGDQIDIFEEERRGGDGEGILAEVGQQWQKLSIMRNLSTSEKDRVKARSVEAERQQKSRKAIILDHPNSLMNNKVASSGDVNGRRAAPAVKPKKEPPLKKRKVGTTTAVVPPAAGPKPRPGPVVAEKPPVPAATPRPPKPVVASSPELPPVPSRPGSAQGTGMQPLKSKGKSPDEAGISTGAKALTGTQKDKAPSPAVPVGGEIGPALGTGGGTVNSTDVRNRLITLLMENPTGMSMKAIEKALGEANIRPGKKQLEKFLKVIANFKTPGKYWLKEGVEKEHFTKPSPMSGSSPDTVPVDSPALAADSPALPEISPETHHEAGIGSSADGERSAAAQHDVKKLDSLSRNSAHYNPKGGEGAVSRAIRKAGEVYRGNVEKFLPGGQDKPRSNVDSPVHKPEDLSTRETVAQVAVDADHISNGGDASPVSGSFRDGDGNEMEVENKDQDAQHVDSQDAHHKKESSDDSSSSSESGSDSDTDSDSQSDSGSGSGSGKSDSDSDSDGESSSSASEEQNMDEDVDIISDEENKPEADVTEASKQKPQSKDSKAQKQVVRVKDQPQKQKQKDVDGEMTPRRSEDVDISDGEVSGVDLNSSQPLYGAQAERSEEVDVDDTSSEGEIRSHPEVGDLSSQHNENATENLDMTPHRLTEAVNGLMDNLHPEITRKSGSESDHSIEEYESGAYSGLRGARTKSMGDQKDEPSEARADVAEGLPSPRRRGSKGTKLAGALKNMETEIRSVARISATTMSKASGVPEGPVPTKEPFLSGGVPARPGAGQKSLLGAPPMPKQFSNQPGGRAYQGPGKAKGLGPKKGPKSGGKFDQPATVEPPVVDVQRGPQRGNKRIEPSGQSVMASESSLNPSEDGEISVKGSEGIRRLFRASDEPGLIGKGPGSRETSSLDRIVRSSFDGDSVDLLGEDKRQNKDPGLLGKPDNGKSARAVVRKREPDQSRPVKDAKQLKRSSEKNEVPDKAALASDLGEKLGKNSGIQRRLPRDAGSWSKKDIEHEMDPNSAQGTDLSALKDKESKVSSDLELGELRDIVAGEDAKSRETLRNEGVKKKEGLDMSSRQPSTRTRISPAKDSKTQLSVRMSPAKDWKAQLSTRVSPAKDSKAQLSTRVSPAKDSKTLLSTRNNPAKDAKTQSSARISPAMDSKSQLSTRISPAKDSKTQSSTRISPAMDSKIHSSSRVSPANDLKAQLTTHVSPVKEKPRSVGKQGADAKKASVPDKKKQSLPKKELQKVEAPISARENGRVPVSAQKVGAAQESRLDSEQKGGVDAAKARAPFLGDNAAEKQADMRPGGKRSAEVAGPHESGRPVKRPAVDPSHGPAVSGRGEPASSTEKVDKQERPVKSYRSQPFVNHQSGDPVTSGKGRRENARVPGPKSKQPDGTDKGITNKRVPILDGKQKASASLSGPGAKRGAQSNGKMKSSQANNLPSQTNNVNLNQAKGLPPQPRVQRNSLSFLKYEKEDPELRGPIENYDQYVQYNEEWYEKYPVYKELSLTLDSGSAAFRRYHEEINEAKLTEDKNLLGNIYGEVQKTYTKCKKRYQHMAKTYDILQAELSVIKRRCREWERDHPND